MAEERYVYVQDDGAEKTRIESNIDVSFDSMQTNNPTEIMFVKDPALSTYEKEQLDEEMASLGYSYLGNSPSLQVRLITVAVSEENTIITNGVAKVTFRSPCKLQVEWIRASLTEASDSGAVQVDVNEDGVSMFSTPITIDQDEKTSKTAAAQPVIENAVWDDDAEITIDIDNAGSNAKGLKITIANFPVN